MKNNFLSEWDIPVRTGSRTPRFPGALRAPGVMKYQGFPKVLCGFLQPVRSDGKALVLSRFCMVLERSLGTFEETGMATFPFGAVFHRGCAIPSECYFLVK